MSPSLCDYEEATIRHQSMHLLPSGMLLVAEGIVTFDVTERRLSMIAMEICTNGMGGIDSPDLQCRVFIAYYVLSFMCE